MLKLFSLAVALSLCLTSLASAQILFGTPQTSPAPPATYVTPPQVLSPDQFQTNVSQLHQENQQAAQKKIPVLPAIPATSPSVSSAPVTVAPTTPLPAVPEEVPVPAPAAKLAVPESLNTAAPAPAPASTSTAPSSVYTGFPSSQSNEAPAAAGESGWNVKY